jgi:hypothetical protein
MNEDMQSNPDYQLVMKFLQSIRPGDMDDESAQQLIAIGQRIQNGGVLSDREREMLNSVVRAMPQMPMDPGDYAESLPMARCQWPAGREKCRWTPGISQWLAHLNCQVLMAKRMAHQVV